MAEPFESVCCINWSYGDSRLVIISSMAGNKHLERLSFSCSTPDSYGSDIIDELLCDASSIESISNSNHTLESIYVSGFNTSTFAIKCLKLYRNMEKTKVIRGKILQFYFVGKFDLSPFVDKPLSVLAEVIGQIEGHEKQSAMYRFLQCIPELCNVSDRTRTSS